MVPVAAVPVIAVIILSGIAGCRIAWAYGTRAALPGVAVMVCP